MEQLSDSDKKSAIQLLVFLLGCIGMYFWVSGGIDRCGSFQNTNCMMSDFFDAVTFLGLTLMIIIGLFGWVWTLVGLAALIGFILYKKFF